MDLCKKSNLSLDLKMDLDLLNNQLHVKKLTFAVIQSVLPPPPTVFICV